MSRLRPGHPSGDGGGAGFRLRGPARTAQHRRALRDHRHRRAAARAGRTAQAGRAGAHGRLFRRPVPGDRVPARRGADHLAPALLRDSGRQPGEHRFLHRRRARAGALPLRARPVGAAPLLHRGAELLSGRLPGGLRPLRVRHRGRGNLDTRDGSPARLGGRPPLRRRRDRGHPLRRRQGHGGRRRSLLVHGAHPLRLLQRLLARLLGLPDSRRSHPGARQAHAFCLRLGRQPPPEEPGPDRLGISRPAHQPGSRAGQADRFTARNCAGTGSSRAGGSPPRWWAVSTTRRSP